jgi:hypothetical protein
MEQTAKLAEGFPDVAKDVRINLQNVLQPGTLSAAQVWGTAIACAHAARNDVLKQAIEADARSAGIDDGVVADAKAAAALMVAAMRTESCTWSSVRPCLSTAASCEAMHV